jgi:hypothetical protein
MKNKMKNMFYILWNLFFILILPGYVIVVIILKLFVYKDFIPICFLELFCFILSFCLFLLWVKSMNFFKE